MLRDLPNSSERTEHGLACDSDSAVSLDHLHYRFLTNVSLLSYFCISSVHKVGFRLDLIVRSKLLNGILRHSAYKCAGQGRTQVNSFVSPCFAASHRRLLFSED